MSSNLSVRFIHPDSNGRGPLEEVRAHGTHKLAVLLIGADPIIGV